MPKELTTQLREKLNRISHGIAKTQRLTRDREKELLGHLEDKAIGYLSGEENMSDEDILLLVKEHFGSPETIQSLFKDNQSFHKTTVMEDMLSFNWRGKDSDGFWGIFLIPWIKPNRIIFTLLVYILLELSMAIIYLVIYLKILPIDISNLHPGVLWSLIGISQIVPLLIAMINYLIYLKIGNQMDFKRMGLRHSPDIQSDCNLVHGMIQCPAIIQYYDGKLVFTPLIGNPFQFPLSNIKEFRESRNFNGKFLFGGNRYFRLWVKGLDERIGFAVSKPQKWRDLFKPLHEPKQAELTIR